MIVKTTDGNISVNIYQPYFYIIQNKHNNMYYAGAKWAKDANPSNFMSDDGYTTSSKIIKKLIEKFGLDTFIIRKLKIFTNANQVLSYETRFLRKVKAASNPKFYNSHENDLAFNTDKNIMICLELYGVENAFQSEEIKEKIKVANFTKLGVPYPMMSEEIRNKSRITNFKRMGVEWPSQSEEVQTKIRLTNMKKRGVEYVSQDPEVQDKKKNTNLVKFGYEWCLSSPEIQEKARQTNLALHGVEYNSQRQDVKAKIRQTNLERYGFESVRNSPLVLEKTRQTKLKKLELLIEKVLSSNIDFGKSGWHIPLAEMLSIKRPSNAVGWLKKNIPELYNSSASYTKRAESYGSLTSRTR